METENIMKHFNLLGLKAEDRVTKIRGIISSLCFDLYGCIQVAITPLGQKNKSTDTKWIDLNRIKILNKKPVMARPDYSVYTIASGNKGCSNSRPNM